jgi:hypothetical protein
LRVVVSLIMLAVGAWGFVATEPTYYLHLPAVATLVFGGWSLMLAVVPGLRAKHGTTAHRLLITAASWAVVLLVIGIVGRAAVAP